MINNITFDNLRELMDIIDQHFPNHPREFKCQAYVDEDSFEPGVSIRIPWEILQDVQAIVGE